MTFHLKTVFGPSDAVQTFEEARALAAPLGLAVVDEDTKEEIMAAASTTIVETTPDALALATRELEPAEALVLRADVAGFFERIHTLRKRAEGISVTARGQENEEKAARLTRLALRAERIEATKQVKELKASTLRRGRAFDGVAAIVREMTEPAEERLLAMETFTARADAADRDALRDARRETLTALGSDPSLFADLGGMAPESWATTLETAQSAHDAKIEAAKQAEAIRVEAERLTRERQAAEAAARVKAEAERVERERLAAEENARLRAEAAEREAEAKAEREAAQAAAQEAERAAKVERDRVAKERAEEQAAGQARVDAAFAQAQAEHQAERAKADAAVKAAQAETDKAARELAKVQAAAEQAKAEAERATREREEADAKRAAAEADAKKPTKLKYSLLARILEEIACWGEDVETCDEPHAAAKARHVLESVGLAPKAAQS